MKTLRASSAERRYLCPGSVHAEDGLPEPKASPEALEGTQTHEYIHRALNAEELPDMNERQEKIVKRFVAKVCTVEGDKPQKIMTETEMMIPDGNGIPVWIAHPDRVTEFDNHIHIWEWKTGYKEQPRASEHIQLRAYILAAYLYLSSGRLDQVVYFGHILSGENATLTTVRFELGDILRAAEELMKIAELCWDKNAKRIPGERQCRYCRARGTGRCPESQQELSLMPAPERLKLIPVKHLGEIYRQWKSRVAPTGQALEKHIRQLLTEGIEVPGLHLGEAKKRRVITDVGKAYQALAALGITGEEFAGECKVSIKNAEQLIYDKLIEKDEVSSRAQSNRIANDILSDVISFQEIAKTIELNDES